MEHGVWALGCTLGPESSFHSKCQHPSHCTALLASDVVNLEERRTNMTYNKPAVTVLGDAAEVIQGGKALPQSPDGPKHVVPAYDLDE